MPADQSSSDSANVQAFHYAVSLDVHLVIENADLTLLFVVNA